MIPADTLATAARGGATTSHTIAVRALVTLLAAVGSHATAADYRHAVLEDNLLGKATFAARRSTFRYLRQLYVLREDSVIFRALGDLWNDDPAGQPLLAGLCAIARDGVFRSSIPAIFNCEPGDSVTSTDLADAVAESFPDSYSDATLAKIGRNTSSSWEQTGHLVSLSRTAKVRKRAVCTPSTLAFALLLGHFDGVTGAALFDTVWARALDQPSTHLFDTAIVASQRSLIDFRHSGGVTEIGLSELLRPMEGHLL